MSPDFSQIKPEANRIPQGDAYQVTDQEREGFARALAKDLNFGAMVFVTAYTNDGRRCTRLEAREDNVIVIAETGRAGEFLVQRPASTAAQVANSQGQIFSVFHLRALVARHNPPKKEDAKSLADPTKLSDKELFSVASKVISAELISDMGLVIHEVAMRGEIKKAFRAFLELAVRLCQRINFGPTEPKSEPYLFEVARRYPEIKAQALNAKPELLLDISKAVLSYFAIELGLVAKVRVALLKVILLVVSDDQRRRIFSKIEDPNYKDCPPEVFAQLRVALHFALAMSFAREIGLIPKVESGKPSQSGASANF